MRKNKRIPKSSSKLQLTKSKGNRIKKEKKVLKIQMKTSQTYKETKSTARMIWTSKTKTIWMMKKNRSKKKRFLKRARKTNNYPKMYRSEFIKV